MSPRPKEFYVPGLLDLSEYELVPGSLDEAWEAFVVASEQGTVFTRRAFLGHLSQPKALWYCKKGEHIRGAVALLVTPQGDACVEPGLCVYNGVMFAPWPAEQNDAQVRSEQFRVTSFLIRELTARYRRLDLVHHPSVVDVRPFLWHHYGGVGPHFACHVRYTSLVKLDAGGRSPQDFASSAVYQRCNKSRRQEIRYGVEAALETVSDPDIDLFLKLYVQTFGRQGVEVEPIVLHDVGAVLRSLHRCGLLRMYITRVEGRPASIAAFGIQGRTAYYLFGANDPHGRSSQAGTMTLWAAFCDLPTLGVEQVDLEGVNSPKRGYFKLSFGGTLTPYYRVIYDEGRG